MRHALMRQQHIVHQRREVEQPRQNRLEQIVGTTRQRIAFLNRRHAAYQVAKPLGVFPAMGAERHLDKHQQRETEPACIQLGAVAADQPGFLQRRTPA